MSQILRRAKVRRILTTTVALNTYQKTLMTTAMEETHELR